LTGGDRPCGRDGDFARRTEAGMPGIHVALRQAAQHLLDASSRSFGDRVLSGFDTLHVHAYVAIDRHAVVARTPREMSRVRARHHRLGRNAPGVDAGSAEEMALDDGNRHACA